MKELRGRNAILTGGSRGIGPLIGRALASEGVNLALAARSAGELAVVARDLAALGVRTVAIPTDITDEAGRQTLIEHAESELGQIDILINNAGIVEWTAFARQKPEDVARIISVNLSAPLCLTGLLLPRMLQRGHGHIVTISSISGKKGIPYEAVYSASKAGLIEWTSALRLELEGTGVGVSVVCPGYVSDVGMAAASGITPPKRAGAVPAKDVARAVVRAIQGDVHEVLVRSGPTRPMLALNALSPALGNTILKGMGVVALQRQKAEGECKG